MVSSIFFAYGLPISNQVHNLHREPAASEPAMSIGPYLNQWLLSVGHSL